MSKEASAHDGRVLIPVPPRYDGTPVDLCGLARIDQADGLFGGHVFTEDDVTPELITTIAAKLLRAFTGRVLEEHYVLLFLRREEYPDLFHGRFSDGLAIGPYCFIPLGHPLQMMVTAFHELGHAMFPASGFNEREVSAVWVSHVFTRKLVAEQPSLALTLRCLGTSFDDVNARDLIELRKTPFEQFPGGYSRKFLEAVPVLAALLKKGTALELVRCRS